MTTSFSNPNYGLDALNSNCLLPSVDHASHDDVIVDNVTSLTSNRCYATDNGLPFQQVISYSLSTSTTVQCPSTKSNQVNHKFLTL